jgi:hypothetical protein
MDESAVKACKKGKFSPGLLNGKRVKAFIIAEAFFDLEY